MSSRVTVRAMEEHILELVDYMGCKITFLDRIWRYTAVARTKGFSRAAAEVQTYPIRSRMSYLVALHELAHVNQGPSRQGQVFYSELMAWEWALGHALVDPGPRATSMIREALLTYDDTDESDIPAYDVPHFLQAHKRIFTDPLTCGWRSWDRPLTSDQFTEAEESTDAVRIRLHRAQSRPASSGAVR